MESGRRYKREKVTSNKESWSDTSPGGCSMRFRPPGARHSKSSSVWCLFRLKADDQMWMCKALEGETNGSDVSKSPQINSMSSGLRHVWTCIVCVWYWLALCPPTHDTQLTTVLKSILRSLGAGCTCEVVLAYPLYHDHSQTIMYQGTPTWIYCVSEFLKEDSFRINIWSYS